MRMISLMILSLTACGSEMTREEARRGFVALNEAMSTSSQSLTEAGALEVACPAGGAMHFEYAVDDGALDAFAFDYAMTFQACVANDVTLDGALRYAIDGAQAGAAFSFSYVYEGALDFSGACEGSCEIDMRGSLSSSGALLYEGTFCGYDVTELVAEN